MGRFALARADQDARRIGAHFALDCRHQPELPPTPAPTYTHKDGGTKKTDTKKVGTSYTSIYASYTPQTVDRLGQCR